MIRQDIYTAIDSARDIADEKHGNSTIPLIANHHPHMALTILTEEVGEVARAILEHDNENLRAELMDILQVCTAWLEAL